MLAGTLVELARTRWRSRGKDLDAVLAEAREAMQVAEPGHRMLQLQRVMAQVPYLKKREPERAPKVHAALLDVIIEAIDAFAGREPQLAASLQTARANYESWRADQGSGDAFEDEVDAIRSTLYR